MLEWQPHGFSRAHGSMRNTEEFRAAQIILTQSCLQNSSSAVSKISRVLSHQGFFNPWRPLCGHHEQMGNDLPFFGLFCFLLVFILKQVNCLFWQFLSKRARSQLLLLRTHTGTISVQNPAAFTWSQCRVSQGTNLFLFPSQTKCTSLFYITYSLIQPEPLFKLSFFILNKSFVQPDHL